MFKILSKEQYEALDLREQVKYEIELEAHKKSEQEKAVKEAVAKELESVKAEQTKTVDEMKTDFNKQLEDAKELAQKNLEALEEKMRSKTAFNSNSDERVKTMSDYITAKLSTEEGEVMLKAFLAGQRKELNIDGEDTSKAVFTTPVGGVLPDHLGILSNNYGRIHGRNLMPVYPTMSNMITFLRLSEKAASVGIVKTAEGAKKGEIEYESVQVQVPVIKIAGFVNFSEEAWDDTIGLKQWLARELPNAYLKAEDKYIFNDPTYGIIPLASAYVNDGDVNPWDSLITAIAQLETVNQYATTILVSPKGRALMRKNKDLINGLYTYPMITFDRDVLRFDGIPVYSTNILTGLKFLVGDFVEGVELRQRKGMGIRYSTENEDNFVKNILTVLIEARVAICVKRPFAFVTGDLSFNPPAIPSGDEG